MPKRIHRTSPVTRREAIAFYLFISPWIVGFIVFLLYPLLSSLYYSFTHYDLGSTPFWIGLETSSACSPTRATGTR